jgi:hypothetical protein
MLFLVWIYPPSILISHSEDLGHVMLLTCLVGVFFFKLLIIRRSPISLVLITHALTTFNPLPPTHFSCLRFLTYATPHVPPYPDSLSTTGSYVAPTVGPKQALSRPPQGTGSAWAESAFVDAGPHAYVVQVQRLRGASSYIAPCALADHLISEPLFISAIWCNAAGLGHDVVPGGPPVGRSSSVV